jgi:hypothetical protein
LGPEGVNYLDCKRGMMIINSSGQIIYIFIHIEGITLGAGEGMLEEC